MRQIVPRIANLLAVARSSGSPVIHLKTEFRANMENAGRPWSRTRQMMEGLAGPGESENPLVQGRPTADIVPELTPLSSDVVVTKTRFSGFWGTNLHEVLRMRNIESLVFTGGTTTVCVESTLRDALFLDYNALVLSDCTADITPELHESALSRVDLFFGWVCSSEELIRALETVKRRAIAMPVT
jgi:ureidoacrylate peracid hydrolase